MKSNPIKWLPVGCLMLASGWAVTESTAAMAQLATPLTERSDYVGSCRATSATAISLFEDARLTKAIGSLAPNTQVTLTGVLGSGTAQIKAPGIGWVQAANLRQCTEGGSPPSTAANPAKGVCRRLRSPEFDGAQYADLKNGLVAYDRPGQDPQRVGNEQDGPGKGAIVYFAEPRQIDGRWVKVFYTGIAGNERLGWVSLGAGGRVNFAECPPPGTKLTPLPQTTAPSTP